MNKSRIEELERKERKLEALEAGGVNNWEWYSESLKGYYEDEQHNENVSNLIDELSDVFGSCAYEPSERGAGIAFNDDTHAEVAAVLINFKVKFEEV